MGPFKGSVTAVWRQAAGDCHIVLRGKSLCKKTIFVCAYYSETCKVA
jgi:hypothetical protein